MKERREVSVKKGYRTLTMWTLNDREYVLLGFFVSRYLYVSVPASAFEWQLHGYCGGIGLLSSFSHLLVSPAIGWNYCYWLVQLLGNIDILELERGYEKGRNVNPIQSFIKKEANLVEFNTFFGL